jgi:GntR family transcriptional regulator/MocR family aminotransferase
MGTVHQLARELDVSRTLAAGAFDQLLAEGYIEARPPNTYVVAAGAAFKTEESPELVLPAFGRTVPFRFDLIDFRPGVPDFSRFPTKVWQRLASEMWRRILPLDLSYGKPEGRAELRREIARHLCTRRGVRCHPEQILVTNGSTQAMGLVSALLLEMSGPACILEDPGALETQRIVTGLGARVHPVPADEHGLLTAALPRRIKPAFIHVTPSHHFPLGGTLPVFRRVQLLKYAQRHSAFIIEEDYDGDFRYDSPPVSSLQGLCPSRVIFIGTFSMSLFPSLRIGYVVVPPVLIDGMRDAKRRADVHTSAAPQLVLARFISEGHFARHIAAMSKAYRESRDILLAALKLHFGDEARILGTASGLHVCVQFPGARFTSTLLNRIDLAGVGVYTVEEHAIRKGQWEDTLVFGFGMLDPRRINTGIAILKRCLPAS